MKKIQIRCETKKKLDLSDLNDFQKDMKSLPEENRKKLRSAILGDGFSAPFFVWSDGKKWWILDGHQRKRVLSDLEKEGWTIPRLPVVEIKASTRREAKRKLLQIVSTYGELSFDGVAGFLDGMDVGDLLETVNLQGMDLREFARTVEEVSFIAEKDLSRIDTENKCPRCGYEW